MRIECDGVFFNSTRATRMRSTECEEQSNHIALLILCRTMTFKIEGTIQLIIGTFPLFLPFCFDPDRWLNLSLCRATIYKKFNFRSTIRSLRV